MKCVVLYENGKPIYVREIKEFSAKDFKDFEKLCEANFNELHLSHEKRKSEQLARVSKNERNISTCERLIARLYVELLMDRGEIALTDEELDTLYNNKDFENMPTKFNEILKEFEK